MEWYGTECLYLYIVSPESGWCHSIYSLVSGKKAFICSYTAFPKSFGMKALSNVV